jgi:nitroreductase
VPPTTDVQPGLAAAIHKRRSVRRYLGRRVPPDIVNQVAQAGWQARPLCPQISLRWYIVWEGSVLAERLGGLAGIYGLFTSAPHYIIAVSQDRPGYLEDLGFRMEQLILAATAQGLGTCWIGEMFTEDDLRDLVPDLAADERIVALTPLGYADDSDPARMVQQLVRWGTAGQGDRKPLHELVSRDTWAIPWASGLRAEDGPLERALEWVRLAPSWANLQPWHMVVDTVADDLQVVATVDHTPQKGNVHDGKAYYRVDGGIAMCHLDLAAQALGWPPAQRVDPDEDRFAWTTHAPAHAPRWHVLKARQQARARARYGIPDQYDILGVFV